MRRSPPGTVRLPRPRPHQVPVLLSPARFKIAVCGRRWGKTLLGLVAAVAGHGPDEHSPLRGAIQGGAILWLAPSYREIIASGIWRSLRHATVYAATEIREVDKRISFPGGGSITVMSAESPESVRGGGYDGVILDEAASISDSVWAEAVRPALVDRQGWAIFIGTPKGLNWFHSLYQSAADLAGWSRWQRPTADNVEIPREEIDASRRELGELAFRQEFLADFVTAGAGMFRREWFRYYEPLPESLTRFATVDLAASIKTTADYTAVASWGLASDGRLYLLDVLRARLEGPDIVPAIRRSVDRLSLETVWIERVGFQLALVQEARRAGLSVRDLEADRDKVARALPATAWLEGGRVLFPRSAPWLADFELELCSFPLGSHDDQVDVLSYAVRVAAGMASWTERIDLAASPRAGLLAPLLARPSGW